MVSYEGALRAMEKLLGAVGETQWRDWIAEDLRRWRESGDTGRHLSAYGGMGSFNDVYISRENGHKVSAAGEPWARNLFDLLKSLCYTLARDPEHRLAADDLAERSARFDPVFTAFTDVSAAQVEELGGLLAAVHGHLHGWRCRNCDHAEVTPQDIEDYLAAVQTPRMFAQAVERSDLDGLVAQVLDLDIPDLERQRQEVVAAVERSGIALREREGWMRPCPTCGRDDTAVARWEAQTNGGLRFAPA